MAGNSRPRIALVGLGAFGLKHLEALDAIEDVNIAAMVDPRVERVTEVATRYAADAATELSEVLERSDIDAVILCTPTPLHADQAIAAMRAGKHVQVEIPLADSCGKAQHVADVQKETGLVCMVGHTRRFNPSHRWVHQKITTGRLKLHQLNVQTYFLRRSNLNALNQRRTWTDHLLWHHAAHTVDLLRYQTGEEVTVANVVAGPPHPELGIAMDMSIQLLTFGGTVCTLSLSFNNAGPFGSVFRYIGDTGTYVALYDNLVTGADEPVDVSGVGGPANGIEAQDRAFLKAIESDREPESSVASVLPAYHVLGGLERQLMTSTS
jgi:2-hydroxy-4-carboxymuconate semialdehyde hemiacetal dehydrogenase